MIARPTLNARKFRMIFKSSSKQGPTDSPLSSRPKQPVVKLFTGILIYIHVQAFCVTDLYPKSHFVKIHPLHS